MNWEAIGAIGEIVGAITVVVTVGYLALQIRQNTAALRSTATQGASEQAADIYHTLSTDAELAMIFVRGSEAPDDLSDSEMARYFAFFQYAFFNYQNWYVQTRDRVIDGSLLSSWGRVLAGIYPSPGFRRFWEQRSYIFSPEFREFMETEVFVQEGDPNYRPLGVGQK